MTGELPRGRSVPPKLIVAAPPRWRCCRSFSLNYARMHAHRANVVGALAQAAKAVMEEAPAVLCEGATWVCNEKRLIGAAGLEHLHRASARFRIGLTISSAGSIGSRANWVLRRVGDSVRTNGAAYRPARRTRR